MTALLERPAPVLTTSGPTARPVAVPRPTRPGPVPGAGAPRCWVGSPPPGPVPARLRPARMAPPRPAVPTAPRAVRVPLRLTRRARLLRTLAVLVLLGGIALAAAWHSTGPTPEVAAPAQVVVGPGDTLWDIAAEIAPGQDPARVVWLLTRANDLRGAVLQPGAVLQVPALR